MKHIINIINQSFFSFSGRLFAIVFGVLYKFYLVDKLEDPTYALGDVKSYFDYIEGLSSYFYHVGVFDVSHMGEFFVRALTNRK